MQKLGTVAGIFSFFCLKLPDLKFLLLFRCLNNITKLKQSQAKTSNILKIGDNFKHKLLLLTYFVPALLSYFAKNCFPGLPQKLLS